VNRSKYIVLAFVAACGGANTNGVSDSGGAPSTDAPVGGSGIGPTGGTLATLSFAIVGDVRPANSDDTAGYPSAIITRIFDDLEAESPRPALAISTGDYMFASTFGSQASPQLDKYLAARAHFSNIEFPAMGNHECTGATASECGPGNPDGTTTNYSAFAAKMLAPLGLTDPWYVVHVNAADGSWTAKFVFIAANYWNSTQSAWLESALSEATTYTFVIRHEGTSATTTPGMQASQTIIDAHPYTLLIVGHTHTLAHYTSTRELIVGNGGAPLTSGTNYGYVVATERADHAIVFTAYDYMTHAVLKTFAVNPDGSSAP
jgi:hypothetical protein